jgi:hypothetical protein
MRTAAGLAFGILFVSIAVLAFYTGCENLNPDRVKDVNVIREILGLIEVLIGTVASGFLCMILMKSSPDAPQRARQNAPMSMPMPSMAPMPASPMPYQQQPGSRY